MKPNLILITVECFRKEWISVFNNKIKNTPILDKIKENSYIFPNYYSTGPWTLPSFYSLFLSEYPYIINNKLDINNNKISITEIFKDNDYYTIGISGGGWLTKYFGYSKGFDYFFSFDNKVKNKVIKIIEKNNSFKLISSYFKNIMEFYFPKKRISDIQNKIAIEQIKNNSDKPIFLWIHYVETHEPYFPPYKYSKIHFNKIWKLNRLIEKNKNIRKSNQISISNEKIKLLKYLYSTEVSYIDNKIGKLMNNINKKLNDRRETITFILGDHGQEFLEHGDFGHCLNFHQELINTPLIIHNKNWNKITFEQIISGIDIGPTLLYLSNIKIPIYLKGKNIFKKLKDKENNYALVFESMEKRNDFDIENNKIIFNKRLLKKGIIFNKYKLIIDNNGKTELYKILSNKEIILRKEDYKELIEYLKYLIDKEIYKKVKFEELKIKGLIKNNLTRMF